MAENSKGIILVVDDQPLMLKLVEAILASGPHEVVSMTDAAKAAEFAAQCERLRLLITDLRMARTSGAELADAVEARRPGIRVLFMSGAAAADSGLELGEGRDFIAKPFTPSELRTRIASLLG